MARYDRNYERGFGAGRPRHLRGEAYDVGMGYGPNWPTGGWGGSYGGWGRFSGTGTRRQWQEGADRGTYGGGYPEYGGYPGSGREGMYYGGRAGGGTERPNVGRPWYPQRHGAGYEGAYSRGYDRGPISERVQRVQRYGEDYAREPFMPETAYLRHPEYDRPPTYHQNRWEQPGEYQLPGERGEMSDEEIRQEVRQRLYLDSWLDSERVEVSVNEGVVTLRGEVNDFLEARYAWDDAWESDGVRGVVNNLTVRTDTGEEHPHGDVFSQDTGG